ncbi:hypothetical protein [Streptomyces sp. bgisy034]|uniref:hypothetical protein n=1 Tax=Streptomyces sp. bgisy034 TaxID=3413774 RepID=UPI003EBB203B
MVKGTAAIIRAYRAKGDGWGLKGKSGIGHKEWSDWKPDPRCTDKEDFRLDLAACPALPADQWEGEDDVALTADEINEVADKVVAKLMAADVIPAAAPPGQQLRLGDGQPHLDRQVRTPDAHRDRSGGPAAAQGVEEKVNPLSGGGVDMDALADRWPHGWPGKEGPHEGVSVRQGSRRRRRIARHRNAGRRRNSLIRPTVN